MDSEGFYTITRWSLDFRLKREEPRNRNRLSGYALVNVLPEEDFRRGHIPFSINVPPGREDEFERRFAKSKAIVVYGASPDCEKSIRAARFLAGRGFRQVYFYAGGLHEWSAEGGPLLSAAPSPDSPSPSRSEITP